MNGYSPRVSLGRCGNISLSIKEYGQIFNNELLVVKELVLVLVAVRDRLEEDGYALVSVVS